MDLIPGIPNEIALECLIRLPVDQFSKAASVCKKWNGEIMLPEFRRLRKVSGLTRTVLAMVQSMVATVKKPEGDTVLFSTQVYRLSVCDPENGSWYDLPPIPELIDGLPRFCRIVGVGSDLVVIGGCDPDTWRVMDCVFVYNFISGSWRRGADMPGQQRSFFGCASDSDRMIVVAGGHDDEKNAMKSALSYDVVKDEWITLPDMVMERDECKVVFHKGKFHVIGGYPTWAQGHFENDAEVFDTATWQWRLEDNFLSVINTSPHSCIEGDDGRLYMCRGGDVAVKEDPTWQKLAGLPAGITSVAYLTACQGKLILVGRGQLDELYSIYALDLDLDVESDGKVKKWTKVETSDEYSGHVQYGCCLEI
ncbi:F-box/kelch-repeat protein At1g80440-like [Solanum stenotomum]|uniref:F-box/kelch-repeat protein At1g80440-like n=1 Tax=Solanum stenotomum TaxID=172797 RepID=UPI0020D04D37|nr:F-box/kelch-repeat protein At1g80440-like [Solanum stenotomum]